MCTCFSLNFRSANVNKLQKSSMEFIERINKYSRLVKLIIFIKFYQENVQPEIELNINKCESDLKLIFESANGGRLLIESGKFIRKNCNKNWDIDIFY